MTSYITHLECTVCGKSYPHEQLIGISPCCEKVLFARYNPVSYTHLTLPTTPYV